MNKLSNIIIEATELHQQILIDNIVDNYGDGFSLSKVLISKISKLSLYDTASKLFIHSSKNAGCLILSGLTEMNCLNISLNIWSLVSNPFDVNSW